MVRKSPAEASSADSVLSALSLSDVQSDSDWMLVKEVCADCKALSGK